MSHALAECARTASVMGAGFFLALPVPTVFLLLTSLLNLPSTAHAAYPTSTRLLTPPRTTVAYEVLNVVAWPPLPTSPPVRSFDLRRRQDTNTICGYIGGDPNLPTTCDAGSHCVLDAEHSVVGCCPNGQDVCTAGVFTGCADGNSGPQTEVNPYVFTCAGGDVCYKNTFGGGYSQWGCGTASSLATSVAATASGLTESLVRPTVSVSFTESVSSLGNPTTVETLSSPITTSSSPSTTLSTTGSSSIMTTTSTSTFSPSHSKQTTSPTPDSAPTTASTLSDRTGVIVGGTIGAAAGVALLVTAGLWLWRRQRRGNIRQGPGRKSSGSTQYVSPMSGGGFAPVHQTHDGYETGMAPDTFDGLSAPARASQPPSMGYHYPGQYPAAYGGAAARRSGTGSQTDRDSDSDRDGDNDEVPLTREIDEFSRGFQDALGRIGEEDGEHSASSSGELPVNEGNGVNGAGGGYGGGAVDYGSMRPLWQQSRRQSRNLMWV